MGERETRALQLFSPAKKLGKRRTSLNDMNMLFKYAPFDTKVAGVINIEIAPILVYSTQTQNYNS